MKLELNLIKINPIHSMPFIKLKPTLLTHVGFPPIKNREEG